MTFSIEEGIATRAKPAKPAKLIRKKMQSEVRTKYSPAIGSVEICVTKS